MPKSGVDLKFLQPLLLLIIGFLFIFLDKSSVSSYLRLPLSYVFEPVSFSADSSGKTVADWTHALADASSYIAELDNLKEELANRRSLEASIHLLEEENTALKEQISSSNKESIYTLTNILSFSPQEGTLRIGNGSKDSIEQGDIVSLGKYFVGIVVQADLNGSLVRSPLSKSSHYEVVIVPNDVDINAKSISSLIKATAVASGSTSGIKLENININSDVKDGDLVVVRDERVGEVLVMGRVVGLVSNPASTSKSGFVSPVHDYANLITVFVKTN